MASMRPLAAFPIPKFRFDSKLVDRLHQHAEIVAHDFAKNFVELRRWSWSGCGAEFCFNHVKHGLGVTSAMVVPQTIIHAVLLVEHLVPCVHSLAARINRMPKCGVHLGWSERLGSAINNGLHVRLGPVTLICRHTRFMSNRLADV